MSYPATNVASYDLSLLQPVSGPITGTTPVEKLHDSSTVGHGPGGVGYARKDELTPEGHEAVVTKVPWYRTHRGITIIAVITTVIICAVVGGAVGGTHHSSKFQGNTPGQQATGSTTQPGQQSSSLGAAPTSSSNAASPTSSTSTSSTTTSTSTTTAGRPTL